VIKEIRVDERDRGRRSSSESRGLGLVYERFRSKKRGRERKE
jgi:hypothetical protein